MGGIAFYFLGLPLYLLLFWRFLFMSGLALIFCMRLFLMMLMLIFPCGCACFRGLRWVETDCVPGIFV
jgi:hypothetical protein